jgi:hypothetical protein
MKYQPLNLGRWVLWSATALVFLAAPRIFRRLVRAHPDDADAR